MQIVTGLTHILYPFENAHKYTIFKVETTDRTRTGCAPRIASWSRLRYEMHLPCDFFCFCFWLWSLSLSLSLTVSSMTIGDH